MTTASICLLIYTSPDLVLSSMIDGASGSIELALALLAIYAVWLSVLEVMQRSGMSGQLARALNPITRRMFKGESEEAYERISLNMSANMLGIGSIATPIGISAIEQMDKGDGRASDNVILFVIINCTSIQLLPTTIIGLRAAGGSLSPADIIMPSLIATTASTLCGIFLCKLCSFICNKFSKNRKELIIETSKNNNKISGSDNVQIASK